MVEQDQVFELLINIYMITQKNELLCYQNILAFLIGFKVDFTYLHDFCLLRIYNFIRKP